MHFIDDSENLRELWKLYANSSDKTDNYYDTNEGYGNFNKDTTKKEVNSL